jgi:hypothetical protein
MGHNPQDAVAGVLEYYLVLQDQDERETKKA